LSGRGNFAEEVGVRVGGVLYEERLGDFEITMFV
jgi:hypothetical protein